MNNDNLANALSAIKNCENVKKPSVITANSTVIRHVLDVLKKENYINGYEVEEGPSGKVKIALTDSINNIGAIKPRFAVKATGFIKFEKRYLPAQGFGILVVSTPKGIMTHEDAKQKNLGGKLIAYCY